MLRSMIAGSCLCGVLRYEVQGPLKELLHCHCSMCRKHHGAPFATFASAPAADFRWLSGEASVGSYASSPSSSRRSCKTCGAVAPTPTGTHVALPAGNLVGELGNQGGCHVFVGSKAPWHVIEDELPQHDAAPPERGLEPIVRPATPDLEGEVHGSCLCGIVTFSVRGAPARWLQCHCSRCRRARSAAHGSNTFYPTAQFMWRSGREHVQTYRPPDAERFAVSFCGTCFGGAPVEREGVPFVLVPAGVFDDAPGPSPEAHIHVASKAPWYTPGGRLAHFAELPPA